MDGPADLLAKVRYDLDRLRHAQNNSLGIIVTYASMDCAVTIASLVDWVKETDKSLHGRLHQIPNMRIVREISNGLKHFVVRHDPLSGYASGAIHLTSINGKPTEIPHWNWIGYDGETHLALAVFEDVAQQIDAMISEASAEESLTT